MNCSYCILPFGIFIPIGRKNLLEIGTKRLFILMHFDANHVHISANVTMSQCLTTKFLYSSAVTLATTCFLSCRVRDWSTCYTWRRTTTGTWGSFPAPSPSLQFSAWCCPTPTTAAPSSGGSYAYHCCLILRWVLRLPLLPFPQVGPTPTTDLSSWGGSFAYHCCLFPGWVISLSLLPSLSGSFTWTLLSLLLKVGPQPTTAASSLGGPYAYHWHWKALALSTLTTAATFSGGSSAYHCFPFLRFVPRHHYCPSSGGSSAYHCCLFPRCVLSLPLLHLSENWQVITSPKNQVTLFYTGNPLLMASRVYRVPRDQVQVP